MPRRFDFKSSGVWYVGHIFDYPFQLPQGCTVRISNTDFSLEEAVYLLTQLREGNNLTSLHYREASGVGITTFPSGEKVCVFVGFSFTARIGAKNISLCLPTKPGSHDARCRIRTSDYALFSTAKLTTVNL